MNTDAGKRSGPPGPKLWCPNHCGLWVEHIGDEVNEPAVLVFLGREPFWFCGVACAASFLSKMTSAMHEGEGTLEIMLMNTISEN